MGLDQLRKKVDELDGRIVKLVNERAEVARRIGKLKHQDDANAYVPSRHQTVYGHVTELNEGPLSDECIRALYREIMSGCLSLEQQLRVAYLGPEGTFTHGAAIENFGESVRYVPVATMEEVFDEVERGRADYGVVPVENSTGGGIQETLARFLESPLKVCAEVVLEIHHTLMAACEPEQIQVIYSRGEVLRQTRRWLQEHMADKELREVSSTSAAAARAAGEQAAAAVGNASLAASHGLRVLYERIEDYPHNVTRFFVLGTHDTRPTGDDKTALLCSVRDEVGALHDLLGPFKEHGINMTKIESFPSPSTPWQYYFFIDFLGHPASEQISRALQEMAAECVAFKVLGAFPRYGS
jgi:chorismate mutase/prephenate dehydratase